MGGQNITSNSAGSATGNMQVTNGNNQTPDTPVGVQDGSRVNGSGAPSRTEAEPITEKRDPQFVYSEHLP